MRTASVIPIESARVARSYKNDPHHWRQLCIEGSIHSIPKFAFIQLDRFVLSFPQNRSISPTRPAPCSTRTFSSRSSPSSRRAGAGSRTPTISARSSSATRCLSRSPRRSPSRHDRSRRHAQSTRSGGGSGTTVLPPRQRVRRTGENEGEEVSYNKTDLL